MALMGPWATVRTWYAYAVRSDLTSGKRKRPQDDDRDYEDEEDVEPKRFTIKLPARAACATCAECGAPVDPNDANGPQPPHDPENCPRGGQKKAKRRKSSKSAKNASEAGKGKNKNRKVQHTSTVGPRPLSNDARRILDRLTGVMAPSAACNVRALVHALCGGGAEATLAPNLDFMGIAREVHDQNAQVKRSVFVQMLAELRFTLSVHA